MVNKLLEVTNLLVWIADFSDLRKNHLSKQLGNDLSAKCTLKTGLKVLLFKFELNRCHFEVLDDANAAGSQHGLSRFCMALVTASTSTAAAAAAARATAAAPPEWVRWKPPPSKQRRKKPAQGDSFEALLCQHKHRQQQQQQKKGLKTSLKKTFKLVISIKVEKLSVTSNCHVAKRRLPRCQTSPTVDRQFKKSESNQTVSGHGSNVL